VKTKAEILEWIDAADISQDDWHEDIKPMLPSDFARGYFTAKVESLTNRLDSNGSEFRCEIYELVSCIA